MHHRPSAGALAGALVALALAGPAVAAPTAASTGIRAFRRKRFDPQAAVAKLDATYLKELEARDPIAARDFRAGIAAGEGRHDDDAALKAYQAVVARLPTYAPALRRACESAGFLNQRATAIALCRRAVAADPSSDDETALALVLSIPPKRGVPAPAPDRKEALELIGSDLASGGSTRFFDLQDAAVIALNVGNGALLHQAVEGLLAVAPHLHGTAYFALVDALDHHRLEAARSYLAEAKTHGLDPRAAAYYQKMLDAEEPFYERWAWPVASVAGAWLAGLLLLLLAGTVLSRLALTQAQKGPGTLDTAVSANENLLRRVYRAVLWVSCVYYYVSVPLMLVFEVLLGGGLIYGFFALGEVPIRLVFVIGAVVLITVGSVLKGLFARSHDSDPGERLDVAAHPRLEAALAEVAERVGTPPVDTVFLVPGTEVAVFERGGVGAHLRGRAERCLILGAGVLEGLTLAELKSILAHEYGHLVNADTAGGGFALAVRRSLVALAQGLGRGGAAHWYNPAWLFLRGFYRAFLGVSQGASRLQEVLADRRSALAYGSAHFATGMRHYLAQSLRFEAGADRVLTGALETRAPLANLYAAVRTEPPAEAEVDAALEKRLSAKPSPYDSHPATADRIAWALALGAPDRADRADAEAGAWSLFEDREAVERQLTAGIRARLRAARGIDLDPPPEPVAAAPAGT